MALLGSLDNPQEAQGKYLFKYFLADCDVFGLIVTTDGSQRDSSFIGRAVCDTTLDEIATQAVVEGPERLSRNILDLPQPGPSEDIPQKVQ